MEGFLDWKGRYFGLDAFVALPCGIGISDFSGCSGAVWRLVFDSRFLLSDFGHPCWVALYKEVGFCGFGVCRQSLGGVLGNFGF